MTTTTAKWRDYLEGRRDGGPPAVIGTLKVLRDLWSPELGNARDILVHLPASYEAGAASGRRYPVLYMHDGQNLFDPATSFAGDWQLDEALEAEGREGREVIAVGILNMGGRRCNEYSPFSEPRFGYGCGNLYLRFITETIKPLIDRDFRTRPDREHTAIAGSSMGGLISLYAFFRHPDVFGAAGAMSPSLWYGGRAILPFVEAAPFAPGRLYLDIGTGEGAYAVKDVQRLCGILALKGYRLGEELLCVEEQGGLHSEAAWARRLPKVLRFLLDDMVDEPDEAHAMMHSLGQTG